MNIAVPAARLHPRERAKGVSVLLGPTNTGKTHYALERMLSYPSGAIGLPLRLLAREVYGRAVAKVGSETVALVTGEERIKPKAPRYWIATLEAMPRDLDVAFVAIDEIQLAADLDRGHVFTDRILNRRGFEETLLIGAQTMQNAIQALLPGARILTRPRFSTLSFAGDRKLTRLPRRSAIVAFSADDVYAIAEWMRRQRGGAAVVLGALSPRTRNAQVELFQSGDVDYIVATDAIGMGLNLDVEHIAFAADRKFDGWQYRRLTPAEFGQVAGRAGRHLRDGTFGTTGRCPPFELDLVEALETHRFDPVRLLQWRNTDLDFSSIADLTASLDVVPTEAGLTRAPLAEDQLVLEIAARDETVMRQAKTRADLARLWECCQIPDYRKLSLGAHAELVLSIYRFVVRAGHIPEDWIGRQIAALDRVDGDLDTLSARIAQVRTWTFIAHRAEWLKDPVHWQGLARRVEDTLSDALHERLAQRFVDRRTSVLMRRLRENAMLEAVVTPSGDVMVEGQHVGQLSGFRFTVDPQADGEAAKALAAAAQRALATEIEGRANRVNEAVDEAVVLSNDGTIRWLGEPVAKIGPGPHVLEPRICVLADEQLTGPALEKVQKRLDLWLSQHIKKLLGPLIELENAEGLEGIARGIAFQVAESLGVLERSRVAEDVKALSQDDRAALRKLGIRFGAYHLYLPSLVKPAPRALAAQLFALKNSGGGIVKGLDDIPHLAASGRTSFAADKEIQPGFYRAAGFSICGDRAVRVDILERLADLIRPALAYRPGVTPGDPPLGAADGDGFVVTVAMTSLAGCSGESFASILRSLGYVCDHRKGPAITVPLLPKAAIEPLTPPGEDHAHAPSGIPDEAKEDSDRTPLESLGTSPGPLPGEGDVAAEQAPSAPETPAAVQTPADEQPVEFRSDATPPEGVAPGEQQPVEFRSDATPPEGVAPGEEAPGEPTAGEEALIEVWRPYRRHHARHEPPGSRSRKRPSEPRERRARVPGTAGTPASADDVARAAAPSGRPGSAARADETRRAKSDAPTGEAGKATPGAGKQRLDTHREFRPGADSTRHGAGERRQGRGAAVAEKKSGERPPDPNSPFAKLLALKSQLEDKSKRDR